MATDRLATSEKSGQPAGLVYLAGLAIGAVDFVAMAQTTRENASWLAPGCSFVVFIDHHIRNIHHALG
jgi:hypothetical protein